MILKTLYFLQLLFLATRALPDACTQIEKAISSSSNVYFPGECYGFYMYLLAFLSFQDRRITLETSRIGPLLACRNLLAV